MQNKGAEINLSKTQLEKSGGFFPLPAVIPFLARAAAIGTLGYAGSKIAHKVFGEGIKTTKNPKKVGRQAATLRKGSGIRSPGKKCSGIYLIGKEPRRY
jgi:hypothetical protein